MLQYVVCADDRKMRFSAHTTYFLTDVTQPPINYRIAMKQDYLNLYTDYLNVTFGYATATGLSELLDKEVSHEQVTRALAGAEQTSKDLWKQVKPTIAV